MADVEARLAALEAELGKVRDHLAIFQVLARYGPLVDSTDGPERRLNAGQLWAEDGVYDLRADGKFTGPQGLAKMLDNPVHQDFVDHGSAHINMLPYVLLDGDRATALGYSQVVRHEGGKYALARTAINYWELVRRDGEWKVHRRTNRLLTASAESHALLKLVDKLSLSSAKTA
jgi:hypothetical protein